MTYHRIDNDSDGNLLRFYYHKKKENRVLVNLISEIY